VLLLVLQQLVVLPVLVTVCSMWPVVAAGVWPPEAPAPGPARPAVAMQLNTLASVFSGA
jgi:hypothetical protein